MTECGVKIKVDMSIIQLDTLLKMLEELRDIKETVCQCAIVSGEHDLYNLATKQSDIIKEIHAFLFGEKKKYWEGDL